MANLFPHSAFVEPLVVAGTRLAAAEAPGEYEAQIGSPLVGPSGAWLFGRVDEATGRTSGGLYKRAGVDGSQVSRVNCIQCRPPENIFPSDPDARKYISKEDAEIAIAHCRREHVLPILRGRSWSRIDLLGDKALRIVAGVEGGIMRWRGSPLPIPELGPNPITVPTIHPTFLARDQSLIPAVVSDLKKSLNVPPEFYVINPTLEQVKAFQATTFVADIEVDMATGQITMVGLCDKPYHAMVVPPKGAYLEELKRIFRNCEYFIGQNSIAFDEPILREHGIVLNPKAYHFDDMLAHALLQPDLPHGLAFLGSLFTQKAAWKHLSGEDEATYCARDCDVTYQVWQQLKPGLVVAGVAEIYNNLSVPLAKICALMHRTGFKVDPSRIGAVREELTKESLDAEGRLPDSLRTHSLPIRKRVPAPPGTLGKSGKPVKFVFEAAEETVTPWRSTLDVQKFLYDPTPVGLGLPVQLHIKSQRPTSDKIALDRLARTERRRAISTQGDVAERHSLNARYLEAIQKLRKLDELLTTFCKEEMLHVDRMYPHFNVHGTSSGRLSSSDPNLQNIPASARYIYVPSHADWRLLEVDYSSIENRLTAYFANDTERLKRWALDPDFNEHRWTASMFFGIPYEEVERDNDKDAPYGKAKRIGHGSNYGMGPNKISKLYDMDLTETKRLCGLWREFNALTVKWQDETGRLAKEQGYLVNPFGRKRWFYCLAPETPVLKADLNWVPVGSLGTGAELIGFDEQLGDTARLRRSIVTNTGLQTAPRVRVITDRGSVVCTPNHGWVAKSNSTSSYEWLETQQLKPGDLICHFTRPWDAKSSYGAGWLSGILDGEGCVENGHIALSQNPGKVLERIQDTAFALGYDFRLHKRDYKCQSGMLTCDSPRPALRILGQLRPSRLLENSAKLWEGKRYTNRQNMPATVLAVEVLNEGPVVTLSTSTGTLIANGLLSHNTDSYYTESLSFLPQSTGADIILRAMVGLYYDRIGWPEEAARRLLPTVRSVPNSTRLLLQVHDSLVFELFGPTADEVVATVKLVMEQPFRELGGLSIPIDIKLGAPGESWGNVRKYAPTHEIPTELSGLDRTTAGAPSHIF